MASRKIFYGAGVNDYWQFAVLKGHLNRAVAILEPKTRPGVIGIEYNDRGYHAEPSILISGVDTDNAAASTAAYVAFGGYVGSVVSVYDERAGYWPYVFVENVRAVESFPIMAAVGQFVSASTADHFIFCEWTLRVLDQA